MGGAPSTRYYGVYGGQLFLHPKYLNVNYFNYCVLFFRLYSLLLHNNFLTQQPRCHITAAEFSLFFILQIIIKYTVKAWVWHCEKQGYLPNNKLINVRADDHVLGGGMWEGVCALDSCKLLLMKRVWSIFFYITYVYNIIIYFIPAKCILHCDVWFSGNLSEFFD